MRAKRPFTFYLCCVYFSVYFWLEKVFTKTKDDEDYSDFGI